MNGKLIVIPTPIGHLDDISIRALNVLKELDLLLCEDSRVTGKLLKHYDLRVPLKPYHAHNEHRTTDKVIALLQAGNQVGIVCDAGTPGLSDPGFLLIREVVKQDLDLEVLPGANAAITAIIASGLPSDRFHFEGFLPHKKGRQSRWSYLASLPHTFILYESPHRIIKCVEEIIQYCGAKRPVAICRELTKMHEELIRGTAEEILDRLQSHTNLKGEIAVVVGGHNPAKN